MGLFNRKREVGSNFDEKKADEIFDSIGETNEKKASDNIKKDISLTKDISSLLKQAKESDDNAAIGIYEKVLAMAPDNIEAYEGLSRIYQKTDNPDKEREILKKAVMKVSGPKKENLMKRLKEL
ncbi:lipopolysaccharide assembly protein LapB [uncultured Methanobrevibacter sp.]|uniref:tetratricopeptide repeat protein n=1 Tax=uncultured Methanobrevibacter sp. TaxID=253161 RepID=UPI0025FBD406|nr:tetratricopeptide repeat protein [uncultured Methanobrevibacter sp.]